MAAFLLVLLIFSMAAHSSANWCVCKKGGNDKVLQMAIDYACGNGADCNPLHQGGKCFDPDTVADHCNYAVNSYFQKKGQVPDSCNFNGAAMVVTTDPSSNGCTYPSSASGTSGGTSSGTSGGTSSGTSGGTTVTAGGTTTKPPGSTTVTAGGTNASPYGNNPGNNPTNTGVLGGGIGPGLGPSGAGMNTDVSRGPTQSVSLLTIMGSGLVMLLWG